MIIGAIRVEMSTRGKRSSRADSAASATPPAAPPSLPPLCAPLVGAEAVWSATLSNSAVMVVSRAGFRSSRRELMPSNQEKRKENKQKVERVRSERKKEKKQIEHTGPNLNPKNDENLNGTLSDSRVGILKHRFGEAHQVPGLNRADSEIGQRGFHPL